MGSKYTKAQAKATSEYMKDKHTFRVVVTNEQEAQIKAHAEAMGESVNAFINRAINEAMVNDKIQIEPVSYQEYLQTVKAIIERNRAEREKRRKEKGLE